MLRNRTVLAGMMLLPVLLYGQDSIFRKDNSLIVCHVQEWNDNIIQYIPIDKPGSEIHFLSVSYVDRIRFENGQVAQFDQLDHPDAGPPRQIKRNHLGIGLLDPFVYTNLRLSYERLSKNGTFGMYLPVTIGFNTGYHDSERDLRFRTGLGMNFYVPRKKGPSFYAVGLGLYIGSLSAYPYYYYEPGLKDHHTVVTLTNSHTFLIRISDRIILAPGFDFHPVNWYTNFGAEFLYPLNYSIRLDLLVNL